MGGQSSSTRSSSLLWLVVAYGVWTPVAVFFFMTAVYTALGGFVPVFFLVLAVAMPTVAAWFCARAAFKRGAPLSLPIPIAVASLQAGMWLVVDNLRVGAFDGIFYFCAVMLAPVVAVTAAAFLAAGKRGQGVGTGSVAESSVTPTVAAAWLTDPTRRHELRYWDSRGWTSHVADAGVLSIDPISEAGVIRA